MIHLLSGVLVDSQEGMITQEMLTRWSSRPFDVNKAKACLQAWQNSYHEMRRRVSLYVLAHTLTQDKSLFAITPVCFGSPLYPSEIPGMWLTPEDQVVVTRPESGGYQVVRQLEDFQYDWKRAFPFPEGLVARILCPPREDLYAAEEEMADFKCALSQLECSFHTHYATWLMLTPLFPQSALIGWYRNIFQSFGWDTPLSSKSDQGVPVDAKLRDLLSKSDRLRVLYEHFNKEN